VSVIHGNWSYTVNKILSIRKPLKITFNITDEKGHPLNVIEFQVISKNKGEYTPKYIGNGVFQAILPEGDYNIILNYNYYLFYISTKYTSSISVLDEKTVTLTLESGINIFNEGAILTLFITLIGLIFLERKEIVLGGFLFYLSFVALLHMLLNNGVWIFPPNLGWESLILTLYIPLSATLIYGLVLYHYRYIKFAWILTFNIISLLLTTVPPLYNIHLRFEIVFTLWAISITIPFIVYDVTAKRTSGLSSIRAYDKKVLVVATKYGGILTPSTLVWELNIDLEIARKILERFCKHGEAYKKKVGSLVIYDFPSARAYLSRTDNQIIELLRDNPYGMSRAELLQATGLSIESLDEALKRLESRDVIRYDMENNTYKPRAITPTS
jgi:predicted transcriptional regulator